MLHHVEIYVSDLERSTTFWKWLLESLGYEEYQKWESGISFRYEETYLVFVQTEQNYLDIPYHRKRVGLNHLAFHAKSQEQVDWFTEELTRRGASILYRDKHPYAGGEGYYAVFFEDPDRMKVEIVAPSLPDEEPGTTVVKPLDTQEEAIHCYQQAQIHCPWYPKEYFAGWLAANREGNRLTRLVFHKGKLAGWCHLLRVSDYPSFQEEQIPEINDLVIFPEFRRKQLASRLLEELERAAADWKCTKIGLGVGLYGDYGPAQLLYAKRGYRLDGKGMSYKNQKVTAGQEVPVDDELLVYLVKDL